MEEMQERSYKIYVTDCLNLILYNSAGMAGSWGVKDVKFFECRWGDKFGTKSQEQKSGVEIAADVIRKSGLKIKIYDSPA